jgi:pimeloyl-ACP methyl ester carboxylesterase
MDSFEGTGGLRIAYREWAGDTDRPAVVLHHGFAADTAANWEAPGVIDALTSTGRRVISIDARGHGRSDKPHDPAAYDSPAMVDDLRRLFDHCSLDAVHLVGYSMGGFVALETATRDDRLTSLVLGGIGAGALADPDVEGTGPPIDRDAVAAALVADDPSTAPAAGRGFRMLADATGADRFALAAVLRARTHRPGDVSGIDCPVLVVTGDDDPLTAGVDRLAAALPTSRLVTLAGDHLSVVANSEFRACIAAFHDEVESGTRAG